MNIPSDDELLSSIRAFLARHNMKPTRFGRDATGEAQLISSIEAGRSPSLNTLQKVADFMAAKDGELADSGTEAAPPPFRAGSPLAAMSGGSNAASSATCSSTNALQDASPTCPTCSTGVTPDAADAA